MPKVVSWNEAGLSVSLIIAGTIVLAWAGYAALRPAPLPFELHFAEASSQAGAEFLGLDAGTGKLERLEVRAQGVKNPVATAIVTRDRDGRLVPLSWANAVTEPVFFADLAWAEELKVLTAIEKHLPSDAVVLSWWDLSRRIRSIAKRQAPLDDPLARGLLTPNVWSAAGNSAQDKQVALWGAGVPAPDGEMFGQFIDALCLDEDKGAEELARIAGAHPAYIAVHLSDIWKVATLHPDLISITYRDFPGASSSHGVMKSARQWIEEQKIEGGYAVEPIGNAIRLHYLTRKADSELLLAKLLPFSTSNPLSLHRFGLVYQYKGFWIYELKT